MSTYDPIYRFPATGLARASDIIGDRNADPQKPAFIAISRTEWYRGIKQGRFPAGIKLSEKTRVWQWEELHALKARIVSGGVS